MKFIEGEKGKLFSPFIVVGFVLFLLFCVICAALLCVICAALLCVLCVDYFFQNTNRSTVA